MRIFTVPKWEKTLNIFHKLSFKKSYTERFRIEYYFFIASDKSFQKKIKFFFLNFLAFLNIFRYIIKYQIFRKTTIISGFDYIVLLSANPSFLKTALPLINHLLAGNGKTMVLCAANNYFKLKKMVPGSIFQHVYICENLEMGHQNKVLKIIHAFFLGLKDGVWFSLLNINSAFILSTNFLRYAGLNYYFSKALINQFKENHTLFGVVDYWLWESLFFTIAKETSARTVVLQHGKITDIYYPLFAKKFFAWGEVDYREMIDFYKAEPTEIVKIGSPYFDKIYNNLKLENFKNESKKKYITFFAQPYGTTISFAPEAYKETVHWVKNISNIFDKYEVVLKLHPFDNADYYKIHAPEIRILNNDLITVLQESIIAITVDSTCAMEAAVLNVPTIQCLPQNQYLFGDMSPSGLTLKATTESDFNEILNRLLNDSDFYSQSIKNSTKALDHYFYNLGNSLNNIELFLEEEKLTLIK